MRWRRVGSYSSIAIGCAVVLCAGVAHADPPLLAEGQHFQIDPVVDGVAIATGTGFSVLLDAIISTGEIKPQTIAPGAANNLLGIDRIAITQKIDPNAGTYSDIGRAVAVGFAILDPILSGIRDGWDAFLVDGVMYGESVAITTSITDITKIAVRRPRPIDYSNPSTTSTDSELSFFSGHTSGIAAVGATATYLAFMRSGRRNARPWLTLVGSVMLTSFVGYERVRAGEHFPTDVICGAMAGAGVGVLVPHLHRHDQEAPPVWIGIAPAPNGATVSLTGFL